MRKTSIAATLALVATVVVHLGAHAQLPPTAGGGAAPSAEAPPAAAPVPEEHASPRATMRTFLEATVAADANDDDTELDRAAACLDLRALPVAGRTDAGRELAIKLKEVIDRVRFVVYDDIPDARAGDPWVFYRAADGAPAIVIARADSGEWLFDAATVARVDDLYRELESHAKVAGVAGSSARLSASLWLRERMPDELKKVGFLFEHWQWLGLVVLFFLAVVIARAVRALLRGPVERWLMKRSLPVPSELVVRALRPIGLMALALTWTLGLPWLGLPPDANGVVILVVQLIAAFGFVRFAFKIVDIVAWELARRAALTEGRFDDLIVPLVQKSLKVVVFCVGVVFIADLAGISPTSLLAGLGLGGLAVALAAQDTVKNFFGSLTVLLDRPFEIGDAVVIGGSTEGVVEEVGFRSTRLRTYDHTLITIPNANLISAKVDNLGRRTFRRFKTLLNVTYDTPPERLQAFCEGIRELIRSHPTTRKEGYSVYLDGLGAHSIDILLIVHFTPTAFDAAQAARHALLLDILVLASRLGVEFAFPTQSLILSQAPTEAAAPYPVEGAEAAEASLRRGRDEAALIVARVATPPAAADAPLQPHHDSSNPSPAKLAG